jgi:hypothetical protein
MDRHIWNHELVQGETGEVDNQGCLVWCTINKYDHKCFSDKLGLDRWIPLFLDIMFEGMCDEKAEYFSLAILKAIPVGLSKSQTNKICLKILFYMLTTILPKNYQAQKETSKIITLFKKQIAGDAITDKQWHDTVNNNADMNATALDIIAGNNINNYAVMAAVSIANTDTITGASDVNNSVAHTANCVINVAAATDTVILVSKNSVFRQNLFEKIGDKLVELFEAEKLSNI